MWHSTDNHDFNCCPYVGNPQSLWFPLNQTWEQSNVQTKGTNFHYIATFADTHCLLLQITIYRSNLSVTAFQNACDMENVKFLTLTSEINLAPVLQTQERKKERKKERVINF